MSCIRDTLTNSLLHNQRTKVAKRGYDIANLSNVPDLSAAQKYWQNAITMPSANALGPWAVNMTWKGPLGSHSCYCSFVVEHGMALGSRTPM